MDYCLLQFNVLKFLLGDRLHGRYQPNFNFFNVNLQNFQQNHKAKSKLHILIFVKLKNVSSK